MGLNDPPDAAPDTSADQSSNPAPAEIISTGDKGTVASHPERPTQPFLVAPTTAGAFNTLGLDIVPVACLSLPDVLFDFDSSFPHADAGPLLAQLGPLRAKHKNAKGQLPPMSVFGHADPVGKDEYNKQLSGRRARAIYGLLTHDLKIWDELFNEEWNAKGVVPAVRKNLGLPASTPKDTVFQTFMNQLFPTAVAKSEFLAGGTDPKGIGDVQGCSDFNPLVVLSTSENKTLSKEDRDDANKTDRRVVVFVFRPGRKVNPAKWPCPAATEGTAKCRKQFFVGPPAGDDRRKVGPVHKDFAKTKDTFACRFYDRIARLSPCEDPVPPVVLAVNPLILFALSQSAVTAGAAGSAQSFVSAAAPTTGAVKLVQDIVLVKKPNTNPKRAQVILRTDTSFDGTGLLTVSDPNEILLFPTINSKTPLTFNGVDNKFSGAQLDPKGAGVSLFAEGKTGSPTVKNFAMTLKLSGGTKKPGPDAVGRMTAIELILDICAPRVNAATAPVPLPQSPAVKPPAFNDKFFLGRPVPIQDAAKIQERAMLMVQPVVLPANFNTLNRKLVLIHFGANTTTFTQETPSTADVVVAQRHTLFSTNTPTTFFVEGKTQSANARDNLYQLGLDGIDDDGDRVNVTVVGCEILSNVRKIDVRTVDIVLEKPPRTSAQSVFFTAPLIIGRSFPIELRTFMPSAGPLGFQWTSSGGAPLTLTAATTPILKLTATGLSANHNDTMIQVRLTTDRGDFLQRHRVTVVHVTIDPVSTRDIIRVGADLNQIRNPAGIVILTGADVSDVKKVAKIEMIHFPVPPTAAAATVPEALGIEPNPAPQWTDDDDRIAWWIIGNDGGQLTGKASFRNDESAKRGTKIHVFGTQEGDVLIQPYSGGFGYGMFRAHVVPLKQVKYRANRIFITAKPAAGGKPPVVAHEPTTTHADIKNFIQIMNVFLRQAGIELIPDNSNQLASSVHNANAGLPALDSKIVAVTQPQTGHFDVEVNDPAVTFLANNANQNRAIQINARNEVITFAFIHSMVPPPGLAPGTIVLASANKYPVNHAPQPRKNPPRNYTRASYTLTDNGTPSSSLIPKDGIPPNVPAGAVKLVVIQALFTNWQPNSPAVSDPNLLWGVIVPTLNTESILPTVPPLPAVPPPTPAQLAAHATQLANLAARRNQTYANIIAHETGHVLGLGHRNGRPVDIFRDGQTVPTNLNLMNPGDDPPNTQNLDIVQVKAIRFSEVLNRNP